MPERRNSRTASTTACRRRPHAGQRAGRGRPYPAEAPHRTRRLRQSGRRKCDRSRQTGRPALSAGRRRSRTAALPPGATIELVMEGALAAFRVRADGVLVAVNDVVVDAVLETAFDIQAVQPAVVGFILAEQELGRAVRANSLSGGNMGCSVSTLLFEWTRMRARGNSVRPAPHVPRPELRQQMQRRLIGPAVDHGDPHQVSSGLAFAYSTVTSK